MEGLKEWREIECECGETCFYYKTGDVTGHDFVCDENERSTRSATELH